MSQILSCGDTNFFVEISAVPDVPGKRGVISIDFLNENSNVCSLTNPYFYNIERRP